MSFLLGSLISGAAGIFGASKAAKAQTEAAQKQVDLSREIYNDQKGLFEPFREGGENAFNALLYEMGLGAAPTMGGPAVESYTQTVQGDTPGDWVPDEFRIGAMNYRPGQGAPTSREVTRYRVGDRTFGNEADARAYAGTQGTPYGGYTKTPGYDFRLQEGINALDASAASRGGLFSGAAGKALTQYGQDYATNEYGNYLARLSSLAGSGQAAAGNSANAGANFASNANNAFANMGNAQAAGWIGGTNAVQGALNNYLGYQQMNKLLAG